MTAETGVNSGLLPALPMHGEGENSFRVLSGNI